MKTRWGSIAFVAAVSFGTSPAGAPSSPILGSAEAVSLCSCDLDVDGIVEVIPGYRTDRGGVHLSYAGSGEARDSSGSFRDTSASVGNRHLPFVEASSPPVVSGRSDGASSVPTCLSSATILSKIPASPDFLASGDFDADGHVDLVAAARGGNIQLVAGTSSISFRERETEGLHRTRSYRFREA